MFDNKEEIKFLYNKANELRKEVVDMIHLCESSTGHFGGSMSAAEIVTVLYWKILNIDPKNLNGMKEIDLYCLKVTVFQLCILL